MAKTNKTETTPAFQVFGGTDIDGEALRQMEVAMSLPITVAGALMPDAHPGYGLPIGGVLATENAVIPYGVGVDIGCRMCLSAYAIKGDFIDQHPDFLKKMLLDHTRFGRESFKNPEEHEVLEHPAFREIAFLRSLHDRAAAQIGTSGSGNHFVEFGILEIPARNEWQLPEGNYLALLSHSGSRGLGAEIARHYTRIARDRCGMKGETANLSWLELSSEAGQEYWEAMTLAGAYASANHQQIHHRISRALGEEPLLRVENHHNFAWKEQWDDGREIIIHRKGATPAGTDVLGIIPGSMTAPGFVVRGKGNNRSLESAAHGAGRRMSRTTAKATFTPAMVKEELRKHGVILIGGGLDEAPMAYKDIRTVMESQRELVDIVAVFRPRIVRMCGDNTPAED
jgi:tRNA-splicing ligase RtcB